MRSLTRHLAIAAISRIHRSRRLAVIASVIGLLAAGVAAPAASAFPGANGPIAFVSDRYGVVGGPVNDEIYLTDETGSEARRVTNNPAPDQFPAVSPNGKEIAFVSNRNDEADPNPEGDLEIYVMDINDDDADGNGDNLRRLTNDAISDLTQLAWSPDGRKLAFRSARDGDSDIYMMDAEGGEPPINLTNIPDEPATRADAQPVFSPDGSKIAFDSTRGGNRDVYLINADGTGEVRITSHPAIDMRPEFSPDGTKLAFVSPRDGNLDIYVMNAEPESALNPPTNLTNASAPIQNRYPSWSPDGTKIAFWRGTGNGFQPDAEIFAMNADGSDPTNLTNNDVGDIQPSWGRARLMNANEE
jgi:Tol biopolymer transport system component